MNHSMGGTSEIEIPVSVGSILTSEVTGSNIANLNPRSKWAARTTILDTKLESHFKKVDNANRNLCLSP